MLTQQPDTGPTPEDRAETAARDLADRGVAVTARAVRAAAGVRMAVAAEAARAWREAAAAGDQDPVPQVPEDVQSRLAAIWADAYRAAVAAVGPERDRLAEQVRQLRAEVDALTDAVAEVESERDEHAARAQQAEQAGQKAAAEREEQAGRAVAAEELAARAEERTAAVAAERDRLAEQVRALIDRIPEARPDQQPNA